jgi:hypothetical protein
MFIITNNCNPEYFNQNAIIDNLRTEVLIMNERRLIYRRLINHLAYLSMMLILISNDEYQGVAEGRVIRTITHDTIPSNGRVVGMFQI